MRIGLASDTHGNVEGLSRALDHLERAGAEQVFFLGGRYADVDGALARRRAARPPLQADPMAARIVRVASGACPEYAADPASRTHVDLVDGRICCLVHDKATLGRDDIENASVLFHGNSATAGLVAIGPRCFVTPGHLRAPAPPGSPPTFVIVELDARELVLRVLSAEGAELRVQRAALGAGGKLSVR